MKFKRKIRSRKKIREMLLDPKFTFYMIDGKHVNKIVYDSTNPKNL